MIEQAKMFLKGSNQVSAASTHAWKPMRPVHIFRLLLVELLGSLILLISGLAATLVPSDLWFVGQALITFVTAFSPGVTAIMAVTDLLILRYRALNPVYSLVRAILCFCGFIILGMWFAPVFFNEEAAGGCIPGIMMYFMLAFYLVPLGFAARAIDVRRKLKKRQGDINLETPKQIDSDEEELVAESVSRPETART